MERDTTEARQYLAGLPAGERPPAEVVLDLFVGLGARIRGDTDLAVRGMSHVLEVLDRNPRQRIPLARHYRAVAASNLGAGLVWSDSPVEADRVLAEAEQQLADLGLDLPTLNVTAHRALLNAMAGRYRQATRRAGPCLDLIDRRAWGSEYQSLGIYLTLGLVHLGRGHNEQAAHLISRGLSATGPITDRAMRLALAIAAVQVAVAQGRSRRSDHRRQPTARRARPDTGSGPPYPAVGGRRRRAGAALRRTSRRSNPAHRYPGEDQDVGPRGSGSAWPTPTWNSTNSSEQNTSLRSSPTPGGPILIRS